MRPPGGTLATNVAKQLVLLQTGFGSRAAYPPCRATRVVADVCAVNSLVLLLARGFYLGSVSVLADADKLVLRRLASTNIAVQGGCPARLGGAFGALLCSRWPGQHAAPRLFEVAVPYLATGICVLA